MLAFRFKNSYFLKFLWTTLSFHVRVHTDMIFRRLTWFWPHLAKIAQVITENLFGFNFLAYTLFSFPVMMMNSWSLMRESWSFPLRIYSVNVTKSAIPCGFGHIYWRNPQWKIWFYCPVMVQRCSQIRAKQPHSNIDKEGRATKRWNIVNSLSCINGVRKHGSAWKSWTQGACILVIWECNTYFVQNTTPQADVCRHSVG